MQGKIVKTQHHGTNEKKAKPDSSHKNKKIEPTGHRYSLCSVDPYRSLRYPYRQRHTYSIPLWRSLPPSGIITSYLTLPLRCSVILNLLPTNDICTALPLFRISLMTLTAAGEMEISRFTLFTLSHPCPSPVTMLPMTCDLQRLLP